jgi:hypothetical protein
MTFKGEYICTTYKSRGVSQTAMLLGHPVNRPSDCESITSYQYVSPRGATLNDSGPHQLTSTLLPDMEPSCREKVLLYINPSDYDSSLPPVLVMENVIPNHEELATSN